MPCEAAGTLVQGRSVLAEGGGSAPTSQHHMFPLCCKQVDAEIISLFTGDCEALLRGEYDAWQAGRPEEALAGILIGG